MVAGAGFLEPEAGPGLEDVEELDTGKDSALALLFKPPLVYVVAFVIVLCALSAIYQRYKEELNPYLFCLFDACATCARGVTAGGKGCCYVVQRCVYPIKEGIFWCTDKCDRCLHPHKDKAKKMQADAPTFHF